MTEPNWRRSPRGEEFFQHLGLIPNSGDRLEEIRELMGKGSGHHFPGGMVIKVMAKKGQVWPEWE